MGCELCMQPLGMPNEHAWFQRSDCDHALHADTTRPRVTGLMHNHRCVCFACSIDMWGAAGEHVSQAIAIAYMSRHSPSGQQCSNCQKHLHAGIELSSLRMACEHLYGRWRWCARAWTPNAPQLRALT